jgi:hypothetical protein
MRLIKSCAGHAVRFLHIADAIRTMFHPIEDYQVVIIVIDSQSYV